MHIGWEAGEFGSDLRVAANTSSEEASSRTNSVTLPEGQIGSVPVDGPTREVHQEGVLASNEAAHAADVDEGESFDPNQFWLLLAQVGYEAW